MKKILLPLLVTFLFVSCQGDKTHTPKTEDEKVFYAVGAMYGMRLKTLGLSETELNFLTQGLKDSSLNKKLEAEPEKYQMKIQEIFRKRMESKALISKKSGKEFLDKFIKDGAKLTKSGLAYKIIKKGKGVKPKASDLVEVHYHGTLIDGTVFDSSVDRGQKVTFPLNRVIKGWTEGLQLIAPGGKIKLVIPSDLAYGDQGAPPKIPAGATLVFDVELFSVKDAPKAPKGKKAHRKGKRHSKKK